jgi:hypothetical protein
MIRKVKLYQDKYIHIASAISLIIPNHLKILMVKNNL